VDLGRSLSLITAPPHPPPIRTTLTCPPRLQVRAILEGYAASPERVPPGLLPDSRREFAAGLAELFDAVARAALLYDDRERRQHDARLREQGAAPADLYGLEHLARLAARLPGLCGLRAATEAEARETAACHADLVRHLDRLAPTLLPTVADM
jgi:hypothetical protein